MKLLRKRAHSFPEGPARRGAPRTIQQPQGREENHMSKAKPTFQEASKKFEATSRKALVLRRDMGKHQAETGDLGNRASQIHKEAHEAATECIEAAAREGKEIPRSRAMDIINAISMTHTAENCMQQIYNAEDEVCGCMQAAATALSNASPAGTGK